MHTGKIPQVSVIMANYNGGDFIESAVRSVMDQTLSDLELIVVDDGSTDNSVDILAKLAQTDARIRVFSGHKLGGPAAVRNVALQHVRGQWVAIVDSDDFIRPDRLEILVEAAETGGADIIIDDLLIFHTDGEFLPFTMFNGRDARYSRHISHAEYVRRNHLNAGGTPLGYAKPLFRVSVFADVSYDESLRIGEDYDLVARLLAQSRLMITCPELMYFCRKHNRSVSHRLDAYSLDALEENAKRVLTAQGKESSLRLEYQRRYDSIATSKAFSRVITALKERDLASALVQWIRHPPAARLFRQPIGRFVSKLINLTKSARPRPDVTVIVRQRIVGETNGSSTYLLSICRFLTERKRRVTLLWPNPSTFGRWPILKLQPEMQFIDRMHWRNAVRIGNFVFSLRPKIYAVAMATVIERLMLKMKVLKKARIHPAPSALMATPAREDMLFVARHAQGSGGIIADYAFSTPYLPFTLSPEAPTAVIMHDFFSARAKQFENAGALDDFASLDYEREIQLLTAAQTIVAIQYEEARAIERDAGPRNVVTAPMAVNVRKTASAGNDNLVFFVGSQAGPNVQGLAWFFEKVWPLVLAQNPLIRIKVAGRVGESLRTAPPNAEVLGMVDDLTPYYEEAGVVISPLKTGSGLKIKLVEALAFGKAAVVTGVTLQGISDLVEDAVKIADEPDQFAEAILSLLGDKAQRLALCELSLKCANEQFSAEKCYAPIADALLRRPLQYDKSQRAYFAYSTES